MRPERPRDPLAGPDSGPEHPFPLRLRGEVIKGFGRGSKELGIPTANIPIEGLAVGGQKDLESGIYFGWAGLDLPATNDVSRGSSREAAGGQVFPMVMSVGWNPFYKNEKRSVEIHIIHKFEHDFYGRQLNLVILGFIRPEYDYVSKEALIEDIETDIKVTRQSLARPAYLQYKDDPYLLTFSRSA